MKGSIGGSVEGSVEETAQVPESLDPGDRGGGWVDRNGLFAFGCVILFLLLAAAYSNHFGNGFHFDDSHVIVDNIAIRSLGNAPSFFVDPHTFSSYSKNALYRPLLTLSYALDYWRAGGLEPAPFHRTQFALLIALGATLVALFRRVLDQAGPGAWNRYLALLGAAFFCIHTANTETVNYLSSRSDLVATLAVALALLMYLRWPGARRFHLYLLPVVIGGLAKPLTVMFAPILFVYVLLFEEDAGARALFSPDGRRKVLVALKRSLPSFVVGGLVYGFLSWMTPDTVVYATVSRWHYLLSQPFVWLHYVRLFFLPVGLTADTDWQVVTDWYDTRVFAGVLFVLALFALTLWLSHSRRLRPAAFGLAWFCLAQLPASSVVPLSEVYNEHRIFFPYVGLTLAATWLAYLGLRRFIEGRPAARWPGALVATLVLGLFLSHAVGTFVRNRVWRTGESLWHDVSVKSPNNGRGRMNYGLTLMRRGDFQGALDQFNRALTFTPDYPHLEVNLGVVKAAMGRSAEAEAHFLRAIRLGPDYAGAFAFYGRWLADNGRGPEAIAQLETAVALSPTDPAARSLLLRIYVATGSEDKLRSLAQATLALVPDDPLARAYAEDRLPFAIPGDSAEDYRQAGRRMIDEQAWLDAAAILRHSLRLDEPSAVAWNNLGWARLSLGFPELAVPCFRRAYVLDPTMQVALNNLREAQRRIHAAR